MSYGDIANELNNTPAIKKLMEEKNIAPISMLNVNNYIKSKTAIARGVAARNVELRESEAREIINTVVQLRRLNKDMWDVFEDMKKEKKYRDIAKTANHLLSQIELQNKLMGNLSDAKIQYKVNIIDLSTKAAQVVQQFNRKGYFKQGGHEGICPHCKRPILSKVKSNIPPII